MSGDNALYEKLLKSIQESNDRQTKEIKEHINKEVADIKAALQDEVEKRTKLEEKYIELKQKYVILEKSLRKNNVIIFGLENDTEKRLLDFTIDTLNKYITIKLTKEDINNIYTIGKQSHHKPIIVKFVSFQRKLELLREGEKLKNTGINIAEELTVEEQKRNKILRQHLKEARSKHLSAYIKNHKLYVGSQEFTAEQLADNQQDTDSEDSEQQSQTGAEKNKTKVNDIPNTLTTQASSPASDKKRNANQDRVEEHLETDPKKRKVVVGGTQHRASPRLTEKDKSLNPLKPIRK